MMKSRKLKNLERKPILLSEELLKNKEDYVLNKLIKNRERQRRKDKEKKQYHTFYWSSDKNYQAYNVQTYPSIPNEEFSKGTYTGEILEIVESSRVKTTIKKQIDMLPDQLHNEIEVALGTFDELFLKRYSNRKINSVTWNKHDCTIVAPVNIKADEVTFIEYQFGDQINKLEVELTAKVIADNVLEAVMKMCLHAGTM